MGLGQFFKNLFGGEKVEEPKKTEATHHVPTVAETVVEGSEAVVEKEQSGKEGVN